MAENQHIINKISVQLNGVSIANAFQWQQQLSACLQQLPARLEAHFNEACSPQQWIHIDKLQVQFTASGTVTVEELERLIAGSIAAQLKKPERKSKASGKGESLSPLQAWIYFLQHGSLPWWGQEITLPQLEEAVLEELQIVQSAQKTKLLAVLHHPVARQRLVLQSSGTMYAVVLQVLGVSIAVRAKAEKAFLKRMKSGGMASALTDSTVVLLSRFFLLQKAVGVTANEDAIEETVKNLLTAFRPGQALPVEKIIGAIAIQAVTQLQKENGVSVDTSSTVLNAGLVLLHPFLLYFFDELDLLHTGKKGIEQQGRALQLLHYLVKEEEVCMESETVLGKVLCGIEPGAPVYTAHQLSDGEKEACRDLLEAVVKNWAALKNTSAEGLRQTFLQRTGKLSRKEDHWLLQVEQKTVDVLLNRLPWGLSIIRLPWMKDWLQVEWV